MKTQFGYLRLHGLGLFMVALGLIWLSGCCDGEVLVTGRVYDAQTGTTLDSVRVSLFYVEKKQANQSVFEYSDSLGYFLLWDAGYCGNDRFFVLASKPGYVSQSLDVASYGPDVEIRLQPN